ncbi:hypothetical protein D3C71_1972220 [compost metagenome]
MITELDNKPVESTLALRKYLYDVKKVGEEMEVTLYREGKEMTLTVTLTDKPTDDDAEAQK